MPEEKICPYCGEIDFLMIEISARVKFYLRNYCDADDNGKNEIIELNKEDYIAYCDACGEDLPQELSQELLNELL